MIPSLLKVVPREDEGPDVVVERGHYLFPGTTDCDDSTSQCHLSSHCEVWETPVPAKRNERKGGGKAGTSSFFFDPSVLIRIKNVDGRRQCDRELSVYENNMFWGKILQLFSILKEIKIWHC